MTTPTRILLAVATLATAVAPRVEAAAICTFYGFISMTESESWHPGNDDWWYDSYPADGVMVARYRYESPTVDGLFTVESGKLWTDGDFIEFGESAFPDSPRMRVEGGKVTQFHWRPADDGGFTSVSLDYWNWDGLGGGNTTISAPRKRPVPESGSTLVLGFLAVAGLQALRRRNRDERGQANRPSP